MSDGTAGRSARLRPDTLLRRVPEVRLRLNSSNQVVIELPDGRTRLYPVGALTVLERLSSAASLKELTAAESVTAQEWIDLTSMLASMVEHGVLVAGEGPPPATTESSYEFDNEWAHVGMLDDAPRTKGFLDAISAVVQPGDIVVDIGTGTGILAMAAVRAGAEHVYAIEAGAIATRAEAVFAANGLSDRITLLRGWSTSVTLPRRADVLTTETLGSEPLDERILEVVTDARQRMLKPGARIVPNRVRVYGTPVEVPDRELDRLLFTPDGAGRWGQRYGFDLRPLAAEDRHLQAARVRSTTCRRWRRLAPAQLVADIDLTTQQTTTVDAETIVAAAESGRLDGVITHFDADVAPDMVVTTNPDVAGDECSWRNILSVDPPVAVEQGQHLRLTYRYRSAHGPNGMSVQPV